MIYKKASSCSQHNYRYYILILLLRSSRSCRKWWKKLRRKALARCQIATSARQRREDFFHFFHFILKSTFVTLSRSLALYKYYYTRANIFLSTLGTCEWASSLPVGANTQKLFTREIIFFFFVVCIWDIWLLVVCERQLIGWHFLGWFLLGFVIWTGFCRVAFKN
jgi:hypothetical protein